MKRVGTSWRNIAQSATEVEPTEKEHVLSAERQSEYFKVECVKYAKDSVVLDVRRKKIVV